MGEGLLIESEERRFNEILRIALKFLSISKMMG